jgi:hypothetical protein
MLEEEGLTVTLWRRSPSRRRSRGGMMSHLLRPAEQVRGDKAPRVRALVRKEKV